MKPRAGQISVNPAGLLIVTTTDVQAALGELDEAVGTPTAAADVAFTPTGSIAATDVQAALEEVAAEAAAGAGAGELLMQDGVTNPPVPIENEAGDDWLYEG